jgi:hypothetical protein
MARRFRSIAGGAVVSALLVATGVFGAPGAFGATTRPVTVAVTVQGGQGATHGAEPFVRVRVGNGHAVPVILDTGSSGLHIFANAVPSGSKSGVTVTSTPADITYAGGQRYVGVVARAVVRIGGQATARRIPFALVRDAECAARKPSCGAAGGIAVLEHAGVYGVLGIGTATSKGPVASPILDLPGRLATSWSVHLVPGTHRGTLVLGAAVPPPPPSVTRISMKRTGSWGYRALWADAALPLCTTVGAVNGCAPTLLDTGTAAFQLFGTVFAGVPTSSGRSVAPGLHVVLSMRGASQPFWSFTAGTLRSENLLVVKGGTKPFVNVGVAGYYSFTVTYDDVAGLVVLSRPPG